MLSSDFAAKKQVGDKGVACILYNLNQLYDTWKICEFIDMQDQNTEGADIQIEASSIEEGSAVELYGEDVVRRLEIDPHKQVAAVASKMSGWIEVKTHGVEQFLRRDDFLHECGTLQFAIWNSKYEPYDVYGSLFRMMYPETDGKHKSKRPLIYTELFTREKKSRGTPFLAISFENTGKLYDRLIELGHMGGMDLSTPAAISRIPLGKEAAERWQKEHPELLFRKQMWHVPFDDLKDLATIRLIGEPPEIFPAGNCTEDLQRRRMAFLEQNSKHITLREKDQAEIDKWLMIHNEQKEMIDGINRLFYGNPSEE